MASLLILCPCSQSAVDGIFLATSTSQNQRALQSSAFASDAYLSYRSLPPLIVPMSAPNLQHTYWIDIDEIGDQGNTNVEIVERGSGYGMGSGADMRRIRP